METMHPPRRLQFSGDTVAGARLYSLRASTVVDANPLESPLSPEELEAHLREVRDRHPSVRAYYNLLVERGEMARADIERELCIALAEAVDSRRLMLVQKWITSGLVRRGKERIDEWTGTHYRIKPKYLEATRKLLAE